MYDIAAEITSNIDGSICPGEEVVYTCVSQGTSQRWRIYSADGAVLVERVYALGQELGQAVMRNQYTLTLISAWQNYFKSTVSVVATTSINNTMVECTGFSSRESIAVKIAGLV